VLTTYVDELETISNQLLESVNSLTEDKDVDVRE